MVSEFKLLLLIILIFISAVIETDIYLPAFADMMVHFQQSEESIQLVLIVNFIALCAVGPIYGMLCDSLGRKRPLMVALFLFLNGSAVTIFADNYNAMLIGRLLQGFGSGGCFTLGTAIIFDIFSKEAAIQALNRINTMVPFIMASAPMLGGYLNLTFGFRANFIAIAICVACSFLFSALFLHETLPKEKRTPFRWHKAFSQFRTVLTSRPFLKLTLVVSLLFAGFLTFLSSIAVLYVLELGIPKSAFPWYQSTLLFMYLIASLTCSAMIRRFGLRLVKMAGLLALMASALALAAVTYFESESAIGLTLAMLPYPIGFIWLQTPYVAELMEIFPDAKGVTASLLTSIRLLLTAAIVSGAASCYNATIMPTTITILAISLVTFFIVRQHESDRI